ncbi:MAG TPA: hypothetical protein VFC14_10190 [Burkholderiales bacterium]|nr:hypothetical protein [Burkholderiales bacterium]
MKLNRLLLTLLLSLALPALAQERTLDPVDEGAKDPSWVSFKNRLMNAVAKRDRKFVAGILHSGVRSGMQGGRGIAEFRKQWELDSDASPLWQELSAALFLGSAWNRREKAQAELCAPYVGVKWPPDADVYSGGAIVAKDALLKAAPSADSSTVATMSYNVVSVVDWEVNDKSPEVKQKWVKIKIAYGEAYLPEEQVRSPIEHTACFVRTEGGWRMIGFGPGGGN